MIIRPSTRRRVLAYAVIGAMADGEPWYVSDIEKRLGVGAGRIYVALAGLEADGVVKSHWQSSDPRRRVYQLDITYLAEAP